MPFFSWLALIADPPLVAEIDLVEMPLTHASRLDAQALALKLAVDLAHDEVGGRLRD